MANSNGPIPIEQTKYSKIVDKFVCFSMVTGRGTTDKRSRGR